MNNTSKEVQENATGNAFINGSQPPAETFEQKQVKAERVKNTVNADIQRRSDQKENR